MNSKFAKDHMERLGWESGKGLGKEEQGRSEALRPELKRDQAGLGHVAEDFGFAWWDHCFNKAAKKIQVEHCQESGTVRVKASKTGIETKLENKTRAPASLLYGSFVAAKKDGDDGEDDEGKDHSTLSRLTDAEIFQRCGGRTAHKGARHGIRQVAKLTRAKEDKLLRMVGTEADSGVAGSESEVDGEVREKEDTKARKASKKEKKGKEGKASKKEKEGKASKKEKKGKASKKEKEGKLSKKKKEGKASKEEKEGKASKKEKEGKAGKLSKKENESKLSGKEKEGKVSTKDKGKEGKASRKEKSEKHANAEEIDEQANAPNQGKRSRTCSETGPGAAEKKRKSRKADEN